MVIIYFFSVYELEMLIKISDLLARKLNMDRFGGLILQINQL